MLAASSTVSSASAVVQLQRRVLLRRNRALSQIRISRYALPAKQISASCAGPAAKRRQDQAGAYHHFRPGPAEASGSLAAAATLYDVLGLPAGATPQEIKTSFRRLARERHPDVAAEDRKDASAEEFIRILSAYATLSDPDKRAEYDRRMVASAPWSRPFSAYSYPSAAAPNSAGSSRFPRRTWETDQCW